MTSEPTFLLTSLDEATGVLTATLRRPARLNAMNRQLHRELAELWPAADADPRVKAILVTGEGRAFSAGGDLDMLVENMDSGAGVLRTGREALQIVEGMLACEKPIVSAVAGVAAGAGLAVALTADVSVVGRSQPLIDGHATLGVAAGDHAAMLWPLLCGMAKAKRYLLLGERLDGAEAERIGLVSMAVDDDEVLPSAQRVVERLAAMNHLATRWTKRSLNHWYRVGGPILELSVFQEMLGFALGEAREGVQAVRERRAPVFVPGPALAEWDGIATAHGESPSPREPGGEPWTSRT